MIYRDGVTGRFITREQYEEQQIARLIMFTNGLTTIGIVTALLLPKRNIAEIIRSVNENG